MIDIYQIATLVLMIIAVLACSLRFYLRVIKGGRHTVMEYALVWATICLLAICSMQIRMYDILSSDGPFDGVGLGKLFFSGTFFYIGSLWGVKISINLLHIQLTQRLENISVWSVRSLWFLLISWPIIYLTYFLGCLPITKHWAAPTEPHCPPISQAWDFWMHLAIHLLTDIFLCILPFPALLKVSEPRLRIAVGGVYCLAFISIAVTIARAVLIATDAQHSTKKIMILTAVELTVCLVIGIFPGISVAFTRKYVNGHATYPSNRASNRYKISHSTNTDLSKHQQMAAPDSVELGHLPPRSHQVTKLEDDKESASFFACGSTDQIVPSTRE